MDWRWGWTYVCNCTESCAWVPDGFGVMSGGEWVLLGELAEAGADRVVVDVVAVGKEVLSVADALVGEASLPDREF